MSRKRRECFLRRWKYSKNLIVIVIVQLWEYTKNHLSYHLNGWILWYVIRIFSKGKAVYNRKRSQGREVTYLIRLPTYPAPPPKKWKYIHKELEELKQTWFHPVSMSSVTAWSNLKHCVQFLPSHPNYSLFWVAFSNTIILTKSLI